MNLNERIYANVKSLCKLKNTKIGLLESRIGMQTGYLSRIGNGVVNISLKTTLEIAEYFGITIDELIHVDFKIKTLEAEIQEATERLKVLQEEKQRLKGA